MDKESAGLLIASKLLASLRHGNVKLGLSKNFSFAPTFPLPSFHLELQRDENEAREKKYTGYTGRMLSYT